MLVLDKSPLVVESAKDALKYKNNSANSNPAYVKENDG